MMFIHEYGSRDNPTIILMAPMMVSGANLYSLMSPHLTDEEQKKLHLDFGEKDFDWKYSKKTIPVYMPKAEVTIRQGYPHCGYMAAETAEYVKQIEEFMKA